MEHTLVLLEKAHQGDKAAREQLVEENLGLVFTIVKRFIGRGTEAEDLFQIGSIGLLKAIDHFDLNFEVRFSTYAVPMIAGEIKRYLRDDGMLKVSRSLKETAYKTAAARERFEKEHGREPTVEEISAEVGISREEIVLAMESAVSVESLQKPVYQSDGTDICLEDRLEEKESQQDKLLDRMVLQQMMERLPEEERELIVMRYFKDMTQSRIAELTGRTQVQVSRMEKKILMKLREEIR